MASAAFSNRYLRALVFVFLLVVSNDIGMVVLVKPLLFSVSDFQSSILAKVPITTPPSVRIRVVS